MHSKGLVPGARREGVGSLSPLEVFLERLQTYLQKVSEEDRRLLVVIAGHNGAGKTTIYGERIADALTDHLVDHLNPDEIEKAITLDMAEQCLSKEELEEHAAKEVNRLRKQYLEQERNFSFETVFSDPVQDKVGFMKKARQSGYLVVLIGVGLDSIALSKARVAARHANGGHSVPEDKIESRYERVLLNFAHGAHISSLAIFFDNSEDRSEDGLDTYWDVACFENGVLIAKDEPSPTWWNQVEGTFNSLK